MSRPDPDRLFKALDATWPAARMLTAGPWILREGLGGGQRVSSATAEGKIEEQDVEQAEAGMLALKQRPLFMIRDEDRELDGWLDARGYDIVDPVTLYVAPAKELAGEISRISAFPSWPPLAVQREIWEQGGIGPARVDVMKRVQGPKTSFTGRRGEKPAATGFVAVHGDIAMVHALEVLQSERRHGVGKNVMIGCANWARDRGVPWLALAVTKANTAANGLYQRMGMTSAASYHYRRAPEARP